MADMGLRVYACEGGFEVWVGSEDDLESGLRVNACLVGLGDTREAALQDAKLEMAHLTELLVTDAVETVSWR